MALLALISLRALARRPDPVLFFPGFTTSMIETKFDIPKDRLPHPYCTSQRDWHVLWQDPAYEVPGIADCWAYAFNTIYDPAKNTFSPDQGVEWNLKYFGSTKGVYTKAYTFGNMTEWGYVDQENLFISQYDFRLDHEHILTAAYMNRTKALVEVAFTKNNNTKVHVLSESLGVNIAYQFLRKVEPAWKRKYLASYIAIQGLYYGTPLPLLIIASTSNQINTNILPPPIPIPDALFKVLRNFGSLVDMMPTKPLYSNDPLVFFNTSKYVANFSLSQLPQILGMFNASVAAKIFNAISPFMGHDEDPEVPTYCWVGTQLPTPYTLIFNDTQANYTLIDGDSCVPLESQSVCKKWAGATYTEFPGMAHGDGLNDPRTLALLRSVVAPI